MSRIERMERGTICRMKGRPYYNHQVWEDGCNRVRYVPANQVPALQKAIRDYRRFMELLEQYVRAVIERTRQQGYQPAPRRRRKDV